MGGTHHSYETKVTYNYITDNKPLEELQRQIIEVQKDSQRKQEEAKAAFEQQVRASENLLAQEQRKLEQFQQDSNMQLVENKAALQLMVNELKSRTEQQYREIENERLKMTQKMQQDKQDQFQKQQALEESLRAAYLKHEEAIAQDKLKIQEASRESKEAYDRALQEAAANERTRANELRGLQSLKNEAAQVMDAISRDLERVGQESVRLAANFQQQMQQLEVQYLKERDEQGSQIMHSAREASVLANNAERKSKQTFGSSGSAASNVLAAKTLLKDSIVGVPSDVIDSCCKKYANMNNKVQSSFRELLSNLKTPSQASSAKGSFVLGTGCSEVCPLIAFLQGSASENGRCGECIGQANLSHPKVTYQFCFDQTDPSKMKVVSFAPHVHSG